MTRIRRCHASRSSSRSARLRSVRTMSWCGRPPCRNVPRRMAHRPEPPGKPTSMVRAGERLLGRPAERLLDLTAEELALARCLEGAPARTMEVGFPGGSGRWAMRRGTFRQGGRPHQLIVLTDLSRALREEERLAWQRPIRVIGHERAD